MGYFRVLQIALLFMGLCSCATVSNQLDTDHDGIKNDTEIGVSTDPMNPDTDGAVLNDYEYKFQTQTTVVYSFHCACAANSVCLT